MTRFTVEPDRIIAHVNDNRAPRQWVQILTAIAAFGLLFIAGYLGSLM
jgi:hypothetical protein